MIAKTDQMAKGKAAEPTKPTVGGRREGAKRKPSTEFGRNNEKGIYLTPDVLVFLTQDGLAAGVAIEQNIRRAWLVRQRQ